MNQLGSIAHITERIEECRRHCEQQSVPFHADALAAALGIPYETLVGYAAGEGTSKTVAALLSAALQECTASVLEYALRGDQKQHSFYMWYLRNRGGFSDKGPESPRESGGAVVFFGEGKI